MSNTESLQPASPSPHPHPHDPHPPGRLGKEEKRGRVPDVRTAALQALVEQLRRERDELLDILAGKEAEVAVFKRRLEIALEENTKMRLEKREKA